jgi:ATP-dependent helicase HepA
MTEEFIPEQRWINDADASLGLGTVLEVDGRLVKLDFPAAGEVRSYAMQGAPLTRVVLQTGDHIEDRDGQPWVIDGYEIHQGLISYHAIDEQGQVWTVPEQNLSDHLRLNMPRAKLFAARLDTSTWFSLRYRSWVQHAKNTRSPLYGLSGARVSLIPHQLYIAAEVSGRHAPRVLLADEVGLGKTIEAGLILHRMIISERVNRVLIVVPDALQHQWLVEMLRRFNLAFSLFNEQRFEASEASNPFLDEQWVLCSLDFLSSSPAVARAALAGEWDLLVVDEAHHLHWTESDSSLEYDLIEALATEALGVLLLTATPEQLGRSGHFGRLRLLDPQRYQDYQQFLQQEQGYQAVAEIASCLMDNRPLNQEQQSTLASMLSEVPDMNALLTADIIDLLVDRHGTGRVLYRNTRSAISGFPGRVLKPLPLDLPTPYQSLAVSAEELLTPEQAVKGDWTGFDPRVECLMKLLTHLGDEKLLVICAHADTVLALREALRKTYAIHAAMFHEHMEIVERDRAAAYFAAHENGSQLLLCSEIGSEGRNFQFAHHLMLFDLPLEPDLLEQRIGRLDRIGQTRVIQLHVPYFLRSPMAVLFHWYADGLNAFDSTCAVGSTLYQEFRSQLMLALESPEQVGDLMENVAQRRLQLEAELEAGRDRLLELHSCPPEAAEHLRHRIEQRDVAADVSEYMLDYWDAYGVEHETDAGASLILHPGNHMLHETFPELSAEGTTVSFQRSHALAHEDHLFLSWEHPMVRGSMELLTTNDLGSVAFSVLRDTVFAKGSLLLELIYMVECAAPAALEIKRFLPPTPVRLLLDDRGNNYAGKLPHAELTGHCLARDRKTSAAVIKSRDAMIRSMLQRGDLMADQVAKALAAEAEKKMNNELQQELARLRYLMQVNANVRDDEIKFMTLRIDGLSQALHRASVRLDAIRVLVCG